MFGLRSRLNAWTKATIDRDPAVLHVKGGVPLNREPYGEAAGPTEATSQADTRTTAMEEVLRDLLLTQMFGADDDDEFVAEYQRISHERDQRALNALAERADRLLRGDDER